jgi:hypothetical protein
MALHDRTILKLIALLLLAPFANILAADASNKTAELEKRLDALAKEAAKPLFLEAQFKVIMKNMHGEPVMATDEGVGADDDSDPAPPKIANGH